MDGWLTVGKPADIKSNFGYLRIPLGRNLIGRHPSLTHTQFHVSKETHLGRNYPITPISLLSYASGLPGRLENTINPSCCIQSVH